MLIILRLKSKVNVFFLNSCLLFVPFGTLYLSCDSVSLSPAAALMENKDATVILNNTFHKKNPSRCLS